MSGRDVVSRRPVGWSHSRSRRTGSARLNALAWLVLFSALGAEHGSRLECAGWHEGGGSGSGSAPPASRPPFVVVLDRAAQLVRALLGEPPCDEHVHRAGLVPGPGRRARAGHCTQVIGSSVSATVKISTPSSGRSCAPHREHLPQWAGPVEFLGLFEEGDCDSHRGEGTQRHTSASPGMQSRHLAASRLTSDDARL